MKLNTSETIKLKELEVNCSKAFAYWYNKKTPESKENYLWHVQEKANFMHFITEKYRLLDEQYAVDPVIQEGEVIY